ncbi:GDSL-type esterase/lipase family protein [Flavobacteriaceae bacterium]|nr:GDSL-type esterase/lipase family protein [Flavobacteriaceae bacterium]
MSQPQIGGSINLNSSSYNEGEILKLEAIPSNNYSFDFWSGDFNSNQSLANLNVDSDKTVIANFSKKRFEINITIEGQGKVSKRLIKSGSKNDYSYGSIVEILALPNNGWTFVEWQGDIENNTTNPIRINIDGQKNITAIFKKNYVGINTSKFLALGDSYTIGQSVAISERWPVQFIKELKTNTSAIDTLQIIAQTGWRVDQLKEAMNNSNLEPPYGLVSLLIGVNNQFQGQDAVEFRPEFIEILEKSLKLVKNRTERLFVVSIPDWGSSPYGSTLNRTQISKEIDDFNSVLKEESEKRGIRYFNITTISRRALTDNSLIASDRLHPSGKMYKLWVDKIIPVISKVNFD